MRSVYKSKGIVYVTDSTGTWIVERGNPPNPYSIGTEFKLKRTWISTDGMTKYGEFESYDNMIELVRSIIQ